jgi:hypothetical protein
MGRRVRHVYARPNEYVKVHRNDGGSWFLLIILFFLLYAFAKVLLVAVIAFYILKFILKVLWRLFFR